MQKIMYSILLVLGIIAVSYGIFIGAANSGSSFFLIWFVIGIGLILIAVSPRLPVSIPPSVKKLLLGTVCVIFVYFSVLLGLVLSTFYAKGTPNLDYLIVLGAQLKQNGPSYTLKYRLDKAADYLKDNPNTKCIVSGGKGSNESTSEAQGMYDYLITQKHIAKSRILIEDRSKTTTENIQNSRKLLPSSQVSLGIVTNNFHLYRGLHLAKKLGLTNSYGIAAKGTKSFAVHNIFRETFGITKDFILKR